MNQFRDSAGKTLTDYPRPSVAVDTAVLTVPDGATTLHVLLVKRAGSHDAGAWALPGTFLHEGERLVDAVLRSLRDKAGIQGTSPKQLHVFDDPTRDDRGWVISVAHLDVVPWPRLAPVATGRDDVRLVPVDDATNLPFDHDTIVTLAVTTLREAYTDKPDPHRLLPDEFTLLQLRRLHEAVMGRPLAKDTFRRTMQPHLTPTDRFSSGEVGKPARIYHLARTVKLADQPV